MYGYIYLTTDTETGKIYIGQHKSETYDSTYYGSGVIIRNIIKKYGVSRLTNQVLCWCESLDELNKKEVELIEQYDAKNPEVGYNIADGGLGGDSGYHDGMLGRHQSQHQKETVSKTSSYKRTDEQRKHMSEAKKGQTHAGNPGMIFIKKDDICTKVHQDNLQEYIDDGWQLGRIISYDTDKLKDKYKNGSYINKEGKVKFIDNSLLDEFIKDGWFLGKKPKDQYLSSHSAYY